MSRVISVDIHSFWRRLGLVLLFLTAPVVTIVVWVQTYEMWKTGDTSLAMSPDSALAPVVLFVVVILIAAHVWLLVTGAIAAIRGRGSVPWVVFGVLVALLVLLDAPASWKLSVVTLTAGTNGHELEFSCAAAGGGNVWLLRKLTEKQPNSSRVLEQALRSAVAADREAVVSYLISRGVDVDARDPHGDTSLIFSASNGDRKMVRFLLLKGADPALAINRQGRSDLVGAYDPEILQDLRDAMAKKLR